MMGAVHYRWYDLLASSPFDACVCVCVCVCVHDSLANGCVRTWLSNVWYVRMLRFFFYDK